MYGRAFDGMFVVFGLFCAAIGAVIMGVIFWLVPWLWSLAKPLLHALTA